MATNTVDAWSKMKAPYASGGAGWRRKKGQVSVSEVMGMRLKRGHPPNQGVMLKACDIPSFLP
jgi:hypothetical protein